MLALTAERCCHFFLEIVIVAVDEMVAVVVVVAEISILMFYIKCNIAQGVVYNTIKNYMGAGWEVSVRSKNYRGVEWRNMCK